MFKWLEKFLARPYEKAAEQAIIDKTEKPKDISEPVISFVECVKKNPSRFITNDGIRPGPTVRQILWYDVSVKDKLTGEVFSAVRCEVYACYTQQITYHCTGMFTRDEAEYVYNELSKIYSKRLERKNEILKIRKERKNKKERERLCKVYCNE